MRFHSVPLLALEAGARWAARLLAAFLVGVVLLIFIGESAQRGEFNRAPWRI